MKTKLNWKAISGVILGFILGLLTIFVDKFIFEKPILSIEINSIDKKLPSDFQLDEEKYPVIKEMKKLLKIDDNDDDLFASVYRNNKKNLEYLSKNLKKLKERRDIFLPDKITSLTKLKDDISTEVTENSRLPYDIYIRLRRLVSVNSDDRNKFSKEMIKTSIDEINKRIKGYETEKTELLRRMPEIESRVKELAEIVDNNFTTIEISTVVVNSGKSGISLRSQGLLKVDIGDHNYIQLQLKMLDFENNSEIPSQGARVVKYSSTKLSELQKEDKEAVINYWGQVAPSTLYITDIFGKIHKTSPIVFSSGLYEKNIYEKLKEESKMSD